MIIAYKILIRERMWRRRRNKMMTRVIVEKRPTRYKPAEHKPTLNDLIQEYHGRVLWVNYVPL